MRLGLKILLLAAWVPAAAGAVTLRAVSESIHRRVVESDDRFYLPPSAWLRVFSLGYREAAADLLWIKTLIYYGALAESDWDKGRRRGESNFTVSYMAAVADLDPRFRAVYSRGGLLTLFHRGTLSRQTVQMAIDLLERGLARFPDDGEIAFNLGFLHYYEMMPFLPDDPADPERRRHREIGIRLLARAALMEGAPPYASVLSSSLMLRESDLDDLVIEHLKSLLAHETNPENRRTLEAQLRRELGRAAERDIESTRRLQERWRSDLPYVPYDLYLVLGPDPPVTAAEILDPLFAIDGLLDTESEDPAGDVEN